MSLYTLPSGVGPSCSWVDEQPEPMEAKEERNIMKLQTTK